MECCSYGNTNNPIFHYSTTPILHHSITPPPQCTSAAAVVLSAQRLLVTFLGLVEAFDAIKQPALV
jgi:hypothetical protein